MNNGFTKVLWILGWIFVFPIPTTILLCRLEEIPKEAVYALAVVAWIIYGVLNFCMFLGVEFYNLMRLSCLFNTIAGIIVSILIISKKRTKIPNSKTE